MAPVSSRYPRGMGKTRAGNRGLVVCNSDDAKCHDGPNVPCINRIESAYSDNWAHVGYFAFGVKCMGEAAAHRAACGYIHDDAIFGLSVPSGSEADDSRWVHVSGEAKGDGSRQHHEKDTKLPVAGIEVNVLVAGPDSLGSRRKSRVLRGRLLALGLFP